MSVAVIIPWREQPSRRYAFHAVHDWYSANMPEADIIHCDTDDSPFNLAACRNKGVRTAEDRGYDICIVNDADTIPELQPLERAIDLCTKTRFVHLPYDEYRSLRMEGTRQYLNGTPLADCDHVVVQGACSGVFVTTPATWWSHGGQDEGFRGWGFEDAAWSMAHQTLLGVPPLRHPGAVYSFHHESAEKEGPHYEANAARCWKYQQAHGNADAMRRLVFGDGH